MLALVAPGQGSQTPGMLTPWLELPGTEQLLAGFSELARLDLKVLGTAAGADDIRDTSITQPLIVALGLIVAHHLQLDSARADGDIVVAGHSVGEVTAAAMAGALRPDIAVAFAARRGAEMAGACALAATGMSAVLGGAADEVLAAIAGHDLTAANRNSAGQIVAAGELTGLAALAANPPPGARVRPLPVAGAFHTRFMRPAEQALADYAADLPVSDPVRSLLSNADGARVDTRAGVRAGLVRQVTRPVRWDLCQRTLRELEVSAFVELAPAGALTGMAKRELPGVELLAVRSPADLDRARQLIAAGHADRPGAGTAMPGGPRAHGEGDIVGAGAAGAHPRAAMEN